MLKFSELSFHLQELYYLTFSIIIIITLFSFLMNLVGKTHKKILIVNLFMLVSEIIYLVFLYEGYAINFYSSSKKQSILCNIIYDSPVVVLLTILILLFVSLILCIIYNYYWSKQHLGKISIKEGIDKLPTGLCFYNNNGYTYLTNNTMNNICSIITGEPLMNGKFFYDLCCKGEVLSENIVIKTGEQPIIKLKNGTIKCFKCSEIEAGVFELIAIDVSQQYELGIELKNKNIELKNMNVRLLEYGKHIERMIRDKEILMAKIRIHDELGHLLLFLKKSLKTNSTDSEKELMRSKWHKVTTLLASEQEHSIMFEELLSHAKSLGIDLFIKGEIPQEKHLQEVIIIAITECLTNTYAHAKGDLLSITIDYSNAFYKIICMNNGEIPKKPIKEGGGLSSLRNMIERIDGTMNIEINPQFILTIQLPKRKKEK